MTALVKRAGVYDLTYHNSEHTEAVFVADRDVLSTIMTTLAANAVVDMQPALLTLEDLFLHYYGKQSETHVVQ